MFQKNLLRTTNYVTFFFSEMGGRWIETRLLDSQIQPNIKCKNMFSSQSRIELGLRGSKRERER